MTTHELHHLTAMLQEIANLRLKPKQYRDRFAEVKGLNKNKLLRFLNNLEGAIDAMILADVFPGLTDEDGNPIDYPAAIHDYLEKDRLDLRP